jgi:hypothetical protein
MLEVWDYDKIGKDDYIGNFQLDFRDIYDNHQNGFYYAEVYGAPTKNINSSAADAMNKDPSTASKWHGRVLLHFRVVDTLFPKYTCEEMATSVKDELKIFDQGYHNNNTFKLEAEFFQALCIPNKKKLKFKIEIGKTVFESPLFESKTGSHSFEQQIVKVKDYSNPF